MGSNHFLLSYSVKIYINWYSKWDADPFYEENAHLVNSNQLSGFRAEELTSNPSHSFKETNIPLYFNPGQWLHSAYRRDMMTPFISKLTLLMLHCLWTDDTWLCLL